MMRIIGEQWSMDLKRGMLFELAEARGTTLLCRAGQLWVTQYRSRDDWLLQAGESLTLCTDGRVVISARRDASLAACRIAGPARSPLAGGLSRLRALLRRAS